MSDFNHKIKKDEAYNKLQTYFDFNKNNETQFYNRIEQRDDITVLTNDILLIQKDDINYYTFKLLTSSGGNGFYNLVIHTNNNQEIIKSEIYEYNPTDVWLQDTTQPYSGYISIVENDVINLNAVFSRAGNNCIVGVSSYWECGDGNNHEPENNSCHPENNAVTQFIIEIEYGPCSDDANDGHVYIAGDEEVGDGSFPSGGGGNNTNNDNQSNTNDADNNTPVIPMEPTLKEEILNCINGGLVLLGSDNPSYIDPEIINQLRLPETQWTAINNYLQDSGCSETAQLVVIEDLWEEFDEQIFVDTDFKSNPCLKSVYDQMGKATTFNNYLQNFDVDMSVANLRFGADENFSSNYETKYHNAMAITNPPLSSNEILIDFNTDPSTSGNILDKPDVFRAVAMIHEIIHAEMYRKMLDAMVEAEGQGTTLDWTDMNRFEFDQYLETLQNKYFGIWDYNVRYDDNDNTPDNGQHQQMAQHYRDIIKDALTDYDPTLTETQKNALSWIGLNEANVVAWQNIDEDPNLNTEDEQNAINYIINLIQNTFPNDCP